MDKKEARAVPLNDQHEYQRLVDDKTQSYGLKAGRVYLEAGQSCGEHTTDQREELLVFLAGSGLLHVGAEPLAVGVGKIAYIPPETPHNVENNGDGPLVYVFCVAPARGFPSASTPVRERIRALSDSPR